MAEILGVVASGMSVVSLAIQVAESIQKLKAFYSMVKEAPTEILLLLNELETLSLILEDIDGSFQESVFLDPRTKGAVMKAYRLCSNGGDALSSLVTELEEGIGKGKKRGGFKMALKKDKIEEIRKRLEGSKATMVLANQCYNNAVQRQNWESHEQDMAEIKAVMGHISGMLVITNSEECARVEKINDGHDKMLSGRPKSQHATNAPFEETRSESFDSYQRFKSRAVTKQSGRKTLLGMANVILSERQETTTTTISLSLPAWIHARRYHFCFTKSAQGWDQTFQSYRTVSLDSPVFRYSMAGNVAGLQVLFETGQASPFEYAALYSRARVCRFLLDNGADATMRTSWRGELGQALFDTDPNEYYGTKDEIGESPFRGLPAYSTPLHFLVTAGPALIAKCEQDYTESPADSSQPLEDDFSETLRTLVLAGHSDIFYKDQFGLTALGSYTGSSAMFRWLTLHEQIQVSNLSISEVQELLYYQMLGPAWGSTFEKFRQIGLPGEMSKEIVKNFTESSLLLPYPNLLFSASISWSAFEARGFTSDALELEEIVAELINAGSELHIVCNRYTMLLEIFKSFEDVPQSALIPVVRNWLRILVNAGVDLIEFGRVENALFDENQVKWTFQQDLELDPNFANYCRFEIIELRFGATPEEFHIEFEDLYVSAQLARRFWEWVERPAISNTVGTMPGAWCDD